METEEEKKKRLEEQAEEMKRRWKSNAPKVQKGALDYGKSAWLSMGGDK